MRAARTHSLEVESIRNTIANQREHSRGVRVTFRAAEVAILESITEKPHQIQGHEKHAAQGFSSLPRGPPLQAAMTLPTERPNILANKLSPVLFNSL